MKLIQCFKRHRTAPISILSNVQFTDSTRTNSKQFLDPLVSACGYVYLLFTMACSFGFLLVLSEYTTNDHLWRGFNNTGGQTFLADVINTRLLLGQFGPFDIYDSFIAKDYSTSGSTIDMRPIAARQIMLAATSLESAISALRANSLYEHIFTIVGHCWVDFSRRFEMAHTAKRQLRCASRQIDNAAVYLETLLRNVDPLDLTQSAYGVQINQIVLTAVATTTGGSAWVTALKNHTWGPISDEVALWQQYNLTRYSIQFENRFQMGLLNSISIVNAFGTRRSMTTTSVTYVSRGLATWSTKYISSGFWNDMTKCVSLGCTLVRNMTNSMEAMGRNWDTVYTGTTVTIGGDLVRSFIGPLMNWDVYQVLPPASLVKLFVMFQTELYQRLRQDESFSTSFQTIHESDVDVVPNDWRRSGLLYYGGNPLCAPLAPAKSFVQMSFNFDDACQTQNRFAMTFTQPGFDMQTQCRV
ncbi:hypothetical protein AeMF1_015956 [Aphanomyces euteiches]|nr:hypothetical protein AeMF1_015956 [Aphanomyces euteiches]KAH9197469.1 hypothetical protein AeNC1_000576 [Aphanomyces euteiches]